MHDGRIRWVGQCKQCGSLMRTQYACHTETDGRVRFFQPCDECDDDITLEPGVMIRGEWVKVYDAVKGG